MFAFKAKAKQNSRKKISKALFFIEAASLLLLDKGHISNYADANKLSTFKRYNHPKKSNRLRYSIEDDMVILLRVPFEDMDPMLSTVATLVKGELYGPYAKKFDKNAISLYYSDNKRKAVVVNKIAHFIAFFDADKHKKTVIDFNTSKAFRIIATNDALVILSDKKFIFWDGQIHETSFKKEIKALLKSSTTPILLFEDNTLTPLSLDIFE